MSAEVRTLLETEIPPLLVAGLGNGPIVDCPVLSGRALDNTERPDQYVVLVAGDAKERGGVVFLVEMEFKAVVPLDDPDARTVATRRLRAISDWLEDTDCPLLGYCSDTLKIHGFSTGGVTDEDGARSYAEILTVTFGAMAL